MANDKKQITIDEEELNRVVGGTDEKTDGGSIPSGVNNVLMTLKRVLNSYDPYEWYNQGGVDLVYEKLCGILGWNNPYTLVWKRNFIDTKNK